MIKIAGCIALGYPFLFAIYLSKKTQQYFNYRNNIL